MAPALLILTALFCLLLLARLGAARRAMLAPRWPALLFAGAASIALWRGAVTPALALAALAVLAWVLAPMIIAKAGVAPRPQFDTHADREALRTLGLTGVPTEQDIRRAFRAKMVHAHPDRGGSHAEAARITAARDHLLRRRRASG